jgi:hypothetical protein
MNHVLLTPPAIVEDSRDTLQHYYYKYIECEGCRVSDPDSNPVVRRSVSLSPIGTSSVAIAENKGFVTDKGGGLRDQWL